MSQLEGFDSVIATTIDGNTIVPFENEDNKSDDLFVIVDDVDNFLGKYMNCAMLAFFGFLVSVMTVIIIFAFI